MRGSYVLLIDVGDQEAGVLSDAAMGIEFWCT